MGQEELGGEGGGQKRKRREIINKSLFLYRYVVSVSLEFALQGVETDEQFSRIVPL
jgi:hypothetical protein